MDSLNQAIRSTLFQLGGATTLTDGELLARFVRSQEHAAFEELVRRHGPMVLRVCRRALHHDQDAEDAFQATFIVLARRAAVVAKMESVGGWLHGVAYRMALKVRDQRTRQQVAAQREPERRATGAEDQQADAATLSHELRSALDEALLRLPEKYRAAIVLCYLEGKTNEDAARLLRCPSGTIRARLSRGRDMLRNRLARRGVALSSATLAAPLAQETASAALAPSLVHALAQAAVTIAAGRVVTGGAISPRALALAEALLKSQAKTRLAIAIGVLAVSVVGASLSLGALRSPTNDPRPPRAVAAPGQAPLELSALFEGHRSMVLAPGDGPLLAINKDGVPLVVTGIHGQVRSALPEPGASATCVDFSGDGATVAVGYWDGSVRLWDLASAHKRATLPGTKGPVTSVTLAPNGKTVVASCPDGLSYWDVPSRRLRGQLPVQARYLVDLAFAAEGAELLTIINPREMDPESRPSWAIRRQNPPILKRWDLKSGVGNAVPLPADAACMALSPEGKSVLLARPDLTLHLWDLSAHRSRFLFSFEGNTRMRVAVSPDAKTVVYVNDTSRAFVWDVQAGRIQGDLPVFAGGMVVLRFSPDGKNLLLAGREKSRESTQGGVPFGIRAVHLDVRVELQKGWESPRK